MIGLIQQINKISHPEGNFVHGQFSGLVGRPAHICLSIMVVNGRTGGLGWWEGFAQVFFDHINNSGDTGHPS